MKNQPKISILITTYNNEQDIRDCVVSAQQQTYQNLEILILNDGSTDRTLTICEELRQNDPRIRIINQPHEGIGTLRNNGIDCATGDYLMFIDGDDFIAPDMLELLFHQLQADHSDLVCCQAYRLDDQGTYYFYNDDQHPQIQTGKYSPHEWLTKENYLLTFAMPWAKLYKKALFAEIEYPNQLPEDNFTTWKIFLRARAISYLNIQDYCYRMRHNSLSESLANQMQIITNCLTAKEERIQFYHLLKLSTAAQQIAYKNYDLPKAVRTTTQAGATTQLQNSLWKQTILQKYGESRKE